jgi:hypothetical protein
VLPRNEINSIIVVIDGVGIVVVIVIATSATSEIAVALDVGLFAASNSQFIGVPPFRTPIRCCGGCSLFRAPTLFLMSSSY